MNLYKSSRCSEIELCLLFFEIYSLQIYDFVYNESV